MQNLYLEQMKQKMCYKTEKGIIILKNIERKVVVLISLRKKMFELAHGNFGHPGIQKMLNIISPNY